MKVTAGLPIKKIAGTMKDFKNEVVLDSISLGFGVADEPKKVFKARWFVSPCFVSIMICHPNAMPLQKIKISMSNLDVNTWL